MKLTASKADLARELGHALRITERNNTIPILNNVLLTATGSTLAVAATDLDVSLRASLPAKIAGEGSLALPAKALSDIVRSLPEGDVSLSGLPDSWLTVEQGAIKFKLAGLPAYDFPALPEVDGDAVTLPAAAMRDLIGRVAFAISDADARYYLAGALLLLGPEAMELVATDGHRMSYAKADIAAVTERRILVPRKALTELGRLLDGEETFTFSPTPNHLVFNVGGRVLTCKTIEGSFPAHEKVFEKASKVRVELPTKALQAAIKRVTLVASERSKAVKLSLKPGSLVLAGHSPDLGEATEILTTDYDGPEIEAGFNGDYIAAFLNTAGTENVALELTDAETQSVWSPKDLGHKYVVMPMRL